MFISTPTTCHFPNNKKAFTLSEVLITLVIIGVISAISIPTLFTSWQKTQTVTALKKAYSELTQAVKYSEIENGNISTWDFDLKLEDFFEKYLKSYVKLSKNDLSNVITDTKYYGCDGKPIYGRLSTFNYSSKAVALNSGMLLIFDGSATNNYYKTIAVDINGLKKPNKLGRDVFIFAIHNTEGVVAHKFKANMPEIPNNIRRTRNELKNGDSLACSKTKYGNWCAALIMYDGWEIKKDYPW